MLLTNQWLDSLSQYMCVHACVVGLIYSQLHSLGEPESATYQCKWRAWARPHQYGQQKHLHRSQYCNSVYFHTLFIFTHTFCTKIKRLNFVIIIEGLYMAYTPSKLSACKLRQPSVQPSYQHSGMLFLTPWQLWSLHVCYLLQKFRVLKIFLCS